MKAGFFTTDITMPIGSQISGGYRKNISTGVLTALNIRAAVFSDGRTKVAFAVVDTCGIDELFIAKALAEVKRLAALQFDAFIISASHAHTAGVLSVKKGEIFKKTFDAKTLEKLDSEDMPQADKPYYEHCVKQLATALIEADKRLEEALICAGAGTESGRVFNRRFKLKDGRSCTHPGKLNKEIAGFAGPIDPAVGVLGAWRKDGSLIGCLLNYACHGTTMCSYNAAHGDWFHYTEQTLKKLMGENVGVVILNGASGDVTQVNNLSVERDFGDHIARELGGRVGAEAYKVLLSAKPREVSVLKGLATTLTVKRRHPSAAHLTEAWKTLEQLSLRTDDEALFAREKVLADAVWRIEPEAAFNLTAVQIGDTVFISNPAELFCQLGLDIKAGSAFPYTFVVELANGRIGYVPTLEAFDSKTGGGYETRITGSTNLDINAGNMIVEASKAMIAKLTPELPPKKDFTPGKLWNYGASRPEFE